MIQRRHSSSSTLILSSLVQPKPPTGNGFGCSNLKIERLEASGLPIVSGAAMSIDCTPPVSISPQSPLVVEVGKIALLVLWFWCSIGAKFCLNSMSTIAGCFTQDV